MAAMDRVPSFSEGRVLFYHLYIIDKTDIRHAHIRALKVSEKNYDAHGKPLDPEKKIEYTFDRQGNLLSSVIFDDAFLPFEKQGRNIFYLRDLYKYNRHGDPIEHLQFVMGEKNVQLLEDFRYEYNLQGQLLQAEIINFADPAHGMNEYYYFDALGRLLKEESDDGFTVIYHYDESGKLDRQENYHDDTSIISHFFYDENDHLVELRKEGQGIGEWEEVWLKRKFDAKGRLTQYNSMLKSGERKTTYFFYEGQQLTKRETYTEQEQLESSEQIVYNDKKLVDRLNIYDDQGQLQQQEVVEYEYFAA